MALDEESQAKQDATIKAAREAASDLDLDSGSDSGREESSGASGFSGAEWSGED